MRPHRLLAVAASVATAVAVLFVAAPWRLSPEPTIAPEALVRITGHHWDWVFSVEWPDGRFVQSVGEGTVPSGIRIRFLVTSADLFYSVLIADLNIKIDAIPGHIVETVVDTIPTGTYLIHNVEYAGPEGIEMTAILRAISV